MALNARIINAYGPTETTIVCTSYILTAKDLQSENLNGIVPLGKPFEGMDFILTDENGNETRVGPGELCFSGKQVFEGYLDNTGNDRFITHDSRKYYKTGDLASLDKNGDLVFHGRMDSQYKINGYRVEAGEVENAITGLTGGKAVVIAVNFNHVIKLVAFVDSAMKMTDLLSKLRLLVPGYMVPSECINMNEFPVNANGKTDRAQLLKMYNERAVIG
jgi:acyl-coenzyme A synthetase/AMP-(fatty) acid ligase